MRFGYYSTAATLLSILVDCSVARELPTRKHPASANVDEDGDHLHVLRRAQGDGDGNVLVLDPESVQTASQSTGRNKSSSPDQVDSAT